MSSPLRNDDVADRTNLVAGSLAVQLGVDMVGWFQEGFRSVSSKVDLQEKIYDN